jgi:DNA-binding response OmpR family regulator
MLPVCNRLCSSSRTIPSCAASWHVGEEGFAVLVSADAAAALRHDHAQLDLAVIDVGLPDADGRDLCQALRGAGFAAPVLFLTARDAVTDRVSGSPRAGTTT